MAYRDLRDFLAQLEATHELKRVSEPGDPKFEMTALCGRALTGPTSTRSDDGEP